MPAAGRDARNARETRTIRESDEMRMRIPWYLPVALLAGCGGSGAPAAAATEAVSAPASAAPGDTLPRQKPGLWEITRTTDKQPKPHVLRVCVDAAQLNQLNDVAAGAGQAMHCTGPGMRHVAGERYTYDATCPMGSGHMTVHSDQEISSTHTRNSTHSTYDPPVSGLRESTVVVEGRWVDASCAGASPGFGAGG